MSLKEELMKLVKEFGVEAVRDETLKILRREMLVAATAKYNLMPHKAEDASIKGKEELRWQTTEGKGQWPRVKGQA